MEAVIMAGGQGSRLRSVAPEIPKPMVKIAGKPVLEYQLESLHRAGVRNVTLVIGYLGNVIREYFGDGGPWGLRICYLEESEPLGTAGALYYLKGKIREDFILVFGDLVLDVDWERFLGFHLEKKALITLYGHPNSHPEDSDLLVADGEGRVTGLLPKNAGRTGYYHNFVNAGVYCVSPRVPEAMEAPLKRDLERDVIAGAVAGGGVFACRGTEYVRDIGTPERYGRAAEDVEKGLVSSRSLRRLQKCVFLDRDGTVNRLNGFISTPGALELLPGAAEAIRRINESGLLCIVITNQPVLARGECGVGTLEEIHRKMETLLGREGAYIDALYYCPHHPHLGYPGEVAELKKACLCRKPGTGLLEKAAVDYHIDLSASWFVGDSTVDVQTGKNAGMRTLLLRTGEGGGDGRYQARPDFTADTLMDAVEIILESV